MISSPWLSDSRPVVLFQCNNFQTNCPLSIECSFACQSCHKFVGIWPSPASWLSLFCCLTAIRILSGTVSVWIDVMSLCIGSMFVIGNLEQKWLRPLSSLICLSEMCMIGCFYYKRLALACETTDDQWRSIHGNSWWFYVTPLWTCKVL
jgi:hypothetical protein